MFLFLVYNTTRLRRGKLTDYYKIVAQSVFTETYKEKFLNRAKLNTSYTDFYEVYVSETNRLTKKSLKLF